jgi:hypothetical protein
VCALSGLYSTESVRAHKIRERGTRGYSNEMLLSQNLKLKHHPEYPRSLRTYYKWPKDYD